MTTSLWRHHDFLRLWVAQTVSEFGSQITMLALPLTAVLVLDATAFEVAALATAQYLPYVLFSPLAGVWVDRRNRRGVLLQADIWRGVALVTVPAAYALDALTLLQLYAVGFVHGTLTLAFGIAHQGFLPSMLRREHLLESNTRSEVAQTTAQLSGPAAAGGMVAVLSAPVAILADALSFVLSWLLIRKIRYREPPRETATDARPPSVRRELRDGAIYVLTNQYLRALMAATALINFSINVIVSILVVFAVRELGLSAGEIGLVFSLGQAGGLLAAAVYSRARRVVGVGKLLLLAAALLGPTTLILALAPRAHAFAFLLAGWATGSFARVIYNVSATSIRQAIVPTPLQGRASGFMRWVSFGTLPLGSLTGGTVAAAFGLREAMVVGAALSFLVVVPCLAPPVRALHDLPASDEA